MGKSEELEKISLEISKLKNNFKEATNAVPGEGNPNAEIIFLGEAPGRQENETGRPFVGRAGKLLTKLIEQIGLKREDVFITSIVKFYPGMRKPDQREIDLCLPLTLKQIEIIKPKLVVLLGNVALQAMLGKKMTITKAKGEIIQNDKGTFYATYHPAAAVRIQKFMPELVNDFEKLGKIIKKGKESRKEVLGNQ